MTRIKCDLTRPTQHSIKSQFNPNQIKTKTLNEDLDFLEILYSQNLRNQNDGDLYFYFEELDLKQPNMKLN